MQIMNNNTSNIFTMKKSILLSKSDYKFLSEHLEKAVMSDYNKSRLKAEIKNIKSENAFQKKLE